MQHKAECENSSGHDHGALCDVRPVTTPAPLGHRECGSHPAAKPEISKFKHGGARENSGGARAGSGRKPILPIAMPAPEPGDRWYLVQTHPREDLRAILELARQGFPVHYPTMVVRDDQVPVPLWPGYMFTAFDVTDDRWRGVHSTPGVRRLFSFSAERPHPMRRGYVEGLIAAAGAAGVIDARPQPIQPGDQLRITSGPFANLVAMCQRTAADRVTVLMRVLGRDVETVLSRSMVQPDVARGDQREIGPR